MSTVCVQGAGLAGLATALMLADDDHRVVVVDRDPSPASRDPEVVWNDWERRSVPQFRQVHVYLSRARDVLYTELPHVMARLLEAGVHEHNPAHHPPPTVTDRRPRVGDERYGMLLGRRSTVECVLHHAAIDHPGIELLPSTPATGLVVEMVRGVAHVSGLQTLAGEVEADLVIDCSGRRSPVPRWIEAAAGCGPDETEEEYGIAYWTQWFRARPGRQLPAMTGRPGIEYGPLMVLRAPADSGWYSLTTIAAGNDSRFRALSDQAVLLRTLRRLPGIEEWVDPDLGQPVGGILPMFRLTDVRRRYVPGGQPCASGIAFVGDSIGASNPGIGRGYSFAMTHAAHLRRLLRQDADPTTITERQHEWFEDWFEPWWRNTRATDDGLLDRFAAAREGRASEPTPQAMFSHAAHHDPDLWRQGLRVGQVLDLPQEVMAEPGVLELVGATINRVGPPRPPDLDVEALLASG